MGKGPGLLHPLLSTPTADQRSRVTAGLKRSPASDLRVSVPRLVLNTWKGTRNQFIK